MVVKARSAIEEALDEAERLRPGELPRALPTGHMGSINNLSSILSNKQLEPRYCSVMRKRVLYLFYGGLFYRSATVPTHEEGSYPVGFLFHPAVIRMRDVHFPFDTGAMARGVYKDTASIPRTYRKSLRVSSSSFASVREASAAPRLLVKHLYTTNRNYLAGQPDTQALSKPTPIPDLLRFIVGANDDSDHRRACIETQRYSHLPLNERLLWIGYPDSYEDLIQGWLRSIDPHVPRTWAYGSVARFRPSDICSRLDERARDVLGTFIEQKNPS